MPDVKLLQCPITEVPHVPAGTFFFTIVTHRRRTEMDHPRYLPMRTGCIPTVPLTNRLGCHDLGRNDLFARLLRSQFAVKLGSAVTGQRPQCYLAGKTETHDKSAEGEVVKGSWQTNARF
jgi:hypothetical protein